MKVSWKTLYALCCVFFLLLLPFVYADESVDVTFTKDGTIVEKPTVGDTVTLTSKLVSANSSDYIRFSLQDDKLKFVDNPNGSTITVYGRYVDDLWIYETEVKVLGDNPQLPKAQVIRDSTQPDLSETEKPQSLSIDLNSEQIVSPNDIITAKAILDPTETVNKNYFNFVKWHVSFGKTDIELDNDSGESLTFEVPGEAVNETITVSAEIVGSECGLNQDLKAKNVNLKVQDNSLSVQIFPSTDSEGIIKGKFIGFSSEILRNGKVAESSISESSEYTWESKIGDEFINGQRDNRTNYAVSPDRVGTLSVCLTVTLKNGLTLKSQTVTKTVVEEDQSLQSITLRKIENGESVVGNPIEITKDYQPQYVTNLEGATYKWTVTQDEKVIASSDKADNLIFTPNRSGSVSIVLEVKPKDSDPITSEALIINILDQDSQEPVIDDEQLSNDKDNQLTNDSKEDQSSNENPDQVVNDSKENQTTTEEKDNSTSNSKEDQSTDKKEDASNPVTDSKQPENSDLETNKNSGEPLKILSGFLESSSSSVNIGEDVVMNAKLSTKGKDGDIEYNWKATDKEGNIIKESNQLKDFTFTSKKPGEVDVSFSVVVKNSLTNSIEEPSYQRFDLKDYITFNDNKTGIGSINEDTTKKADLENSDSDDSDQPDLKTSESENLEPKETELVKEVSPAEESTTSQEPVDSKVTTTNSEKKDLTVSETGSIKQQASQTENEKNGIGLSTSSLNTSNNPTTISNTKSNNTVPVSTVSSSMMNKGSNVVNPQTGVELTIGQVSVIIVCVLLIIITTGIFIRKLVSLN